MASLDDVHGKCLDLERRRIYLHGDSMVKDDEPGVDYRMMNTFIKNMDLVSAAPGDITIVMGTVGGEWNYGMGIYDAIKNCPHKVTIVGYAWARSMSSIILQAADRRILMPHCDFMVHYGTSAYEGHYLCAKSGMRFEERTEATMLRIYAERCQWGPYFKYQTNQSVSEIMEFIAKQMKEHGDWWMRAEEAVMYGFADEVMQWPTKNRTS